MLTFLKAQASSVASTAVDFGTYLLLSKVAGIYYLAASVTGNLAGGAANFLLGRQWVFGGKGKRTRPQAIRYLLVWNGNLLLNAGGVYALKEWAGMDATWAKALVSVMLGVTWNYFLQKKFVFR